MPFTLVGYYESVDQGGAYTYLNAVPDPHVTVSGDDIIVPTLNKLVAVAVVTDLTVAARARFVAPSLSEDGFDEYVEPVASGLTFGAEPEVTDMRANPIELDASEALKCEVYANPA